ncbi:SPFH domain-containing protein [Exilibacterium tricleocarpae]|uniref:SPFH domain-containing protein n=1 Tax=Exilibacterium tricleocarpae TaxID=2591008 RepID=A0A545SNG0_9GAMM|nr:SPFH domain-containing protein [Exilibacterium tricleocarpae]TQV66518.1 SPFH domain-containing protein [Exilibacterium tricleocarpae]
MIKEKKASSTSGYSMIVVLLVLQVASVWAIVTMPAFWNLVAVVVTIIVLICWFGLYMVHPNQGKVMQLFGKYAGTDRSAGLRWANPLYSKTKVSLRVRNFESGKLKVNDKNGNPIEIAAVVVWRVVDTAEAVFEVDDYEEFVTIQSEAAIRNLATRYPYDNHEAEEICLRGNAKDIAELARKEIRARLDKAGVDVIEARISHLAYAPEIAQAMLQRQQAGAIVAARHKIVEGAVGMVELALEKLKQQNVVELDEERKAAMVSNLMVVLCGDQNTQPVVNAGTLYN